VKEFIGLQVPAQLGATRACNCCAQLSRSSFAGVWFQAVADGFRLPTPPRPHKIPGSGEHQSAGIKSGLANFDRAVQVLEMFPDIDRAINFLLAEKGMQ